MTERVDELASVLSDLMAHALQRNDFENLLEIAVASRLLFRALPGGDKQSRSVLSNMEYALNLLIGKEKPVDLSAIEKRCSFCGREEPEVMLGAGADAFICDDCVGLFTEIFSKRKEQSGSPKKEA